MSFWSRPQSDTVYSNCSCEHTKANTSGPLNEIQIIQHENQNWICMTITLIEKWSNTWSLFMKLQTWKYGGNSTGGVLRIVTASPRAWTELQVSVQEWQRRSQMWEQNQANQRLDIHRFIIMCIVVSRGPLAATLVCLQNAVAVYISDEDETFKWRCIWCQTTRAWVFNDIGCTPEYGSDTSTSGDTGTLHATTQQRQRSCCVHVTVTCVKLNTWTCQQIPHMQMVIWASHEIVRWATMSKCNRPGERQTKETIKIAVADPQ